MSDRNFDGLGRLFNDRIYATTKGRIRLALLQRDLLEVLPDLLQPTQPLSILDAGGGTGPLSLPLAQAGHEVTLCDLSEEMIAEARNRSLQLGVAKRVNFFVGSLQDFSQHSHHPFDLVLCHAVLEWVVDPQALIDSLLLHLAPQGMLSLMFYNLHSTVFRSLVRGYLDKVKEGRFCGNGQGLTPTHPREPEQVLDWLQQRGLSVELKSGIRVFQDYMHKDVRNRRSEADILALEMRYSRLEPYRSMGRYYHILAKR